MLPACTSAQKPYIIGHTNSTGSYSGSEGNTPGEACVAFFAPSGPHASLAITRLSEFECVISNSTNVYPVRKVCDDAPQFTVEKMQDMSALWGMFLLAAIVILCLRKLFNVFDKAPHGEN